MNQTCYISKIQQLFAKNQRQHDYVQSWPFTQIAYRITNTHHIIPHKSDIHHIMEFSVCLKRREWNVSVSQQEHCQKHFEPSSSLPFLARFANVTYTLDIFDAQYVIGKCIVCTLLIIDILFG